MTCKGSCHLSHTKAEQRASMLWGATRGDTEAANTGLSAVDTGSHTLDFVEHCGNVHEAEHLSLKYHKRAENPSHPDPASYQLMSTLAAK